MLLYLWAWGRNGTSQGGTAGHQPSLKLPDPKAGLAPATVLAGKGALGPRCCSLVCVEAGGAGGTGGGREVVGAGLPEPE